MQYIVIFSGLVTIIVGFIAAYQFIKSIKHPIARKPGAILGVITVFLIIVTVVLANSPLSRGEGTLNPAPGTDQLSVTATATQQPSPEPTITSTTAPTVTLTPVLRPGTVLYQADWSHGMSGWAGNSNWKTVSGMLVSDGTKEDYAIAGSTVMAPYAPPVADYAIEAAIQFEKCSDFGCDFGIAARLAQDNSGRTDGYIGGVGRLNDFGGRSPLANIHTGSSYILNSINILGQVDYTLDNAWHTYRLEVRGNQMRLFIDGQQEVDGTDNLFLASGHVGLVSYASQINVRSFKVIAL